MTKQFDPRKPVTAHVVYSSQRVIHRLTRFPDMSAFLDALKANGWTANRRHGFIERHFRNGRFFLAEVINTPS